MKQFLLNFLDAFWIRGIPTQRSNPVTAPKPGKIHPVHYLLHLASGCLVLALSVGIHVWITNQIKHHRMVRWASGQLETNYSAIFPVDSMRPGEKLEMGITEDGVVVERIVH